MLQQLLLLADSDVRTYFNLEPLFQLSTVGWLLVFFVVVAAIAFIVVMYVLDSVELPSGITATLMALRILALFGMILFLLNPAIRSERRIVKNSRVFMLIDTSISMGLRDVGSTPVPAAPSRIEQVAAELADGKLIRSLRDEHDVVVYRFDQETKPVAIASYPKMAEKKSADSDEETVTGQRALSLGLSRRIATVSAVVLFFSIVLGVASFVIRIKSHLRGMASWGLFAALALFVISMFVLAAADLWSSDLPMLAIMGFTSNYAVDDEEPASEVEESENADEKEILADWKTELVPRGTETRLGETLRYIVNKERGGSVAGIVVFSDGRNNAGVEPTTAIYAARDANIPIYTVGMGNNKQPANVRVVDLEAPRRVYPGDKFTLKGLIQAYGLSGRRVKVQLVSTRENDPDQIERFQEDRTIELAEDGKELSAVFEIEPDKDDGRRVYKLKVLPPEQDLDARDNDKTAVVEVVDRRSLVLIIAGGPTREFRFLRNQLYRDQSTTLHVFLQTSQPGTQQEGDELLFEFPETADELFEYDCVVAFDPDWRALSAEQVDLLDRWVAEKAGGLILIAGPVFTPKWTRGNQGDDKIATLRGLYPVSFFNQGSATIKLGRFGGEEAWPLAFTREGRSADFLWLEDSPEKAHMAWDDFAGVYGYYAVNEPKPGATVYARFSDPATASGPGDNLPIYLASQFYGAGRVIFQASGEMWRIRALNDKYFEQYYTKLIRWVSQGRLLRDSTRGVLLADKDRCLLGDHVEVRAILTDAQHLPLMDDEVSAVLIQPDSTRQTLTLRRLKTEAREGTFSARFTTLQEGDYRIALAIPDSATAELLTREVRVRMPDLEIERPQRNDVLLTDIAERTGGVYFVGMDEAMNRSGSGVSVVSSLQPNDQTTYIPGTPNQNFTTKLMGWLLALICGVLSLEWLIRRLNKLA